MNQEIESKLDELQKRIASEEAKRCEDYAVLYRLTSDLRKMVKGLRLRCAIDSMILLLSYVAVRILLNLIGG